MLICYTGQYPMPHPAVDSVEFTFYLDTPFDDCTRAEDDAFQCAHDNAFWDEYYNTENSFYLLEEYAEEYNASRELFNWNWFD